MCQSLLPRRQFRQRLRKLLIPRLQRRPKPLQLLNLLRDGKRSVGDLAEATGFSTANVSRHLALLAQHGMLTREAHGTTVLYGIADPAIYGLCDLVCGNLARRFEANKWLGGVVFASAVAGRLLA